MSAGQLSCATLAEVQLKADQLWDSSLKKDYIANVVALDAVRKEQTVQIPELQDSAKDKTVKLIWTQDCETTVSDCSNECTVGGSELEAKCESHTLDICKTTGFTIDEKKLRSKLVTKEELIAKGMLRRMKLLDEYLAQTMVAKLDSFKGVNQFTDGKGTVSGFETSIAASLWNPSLFSYFQLAAIKNQFADAYLLNGSNLYEAYWNAQMNAGNTDGKGAVAQFDSFRKYWDVFNVDSTLGEKSTFLIDRNAVAFVSKTYYPWSGGEESANQYGGAGGSVGMKYQVESRNLPGLFYDVTYKVECVSNEIKHHFTFQANAGIFRNPVGCNANNTGILKFVCA